MSDEVKVFVLTWNLKSKGPKEDFRALLGLEGKSLPDIYAFGYQEAPILRPANLVAEEPWVGQMRRLLSEKNYVKLAHIRLQGIILAVYAQRQHITAISNLEVHYTRTGFGGLWGNKGGVSMRMNYRGCSLCFVNCHLAAHDHKLDQRISDYHSIMNNQTFYCSSTNNIVAHDYVILMGDLNFRINDFTAKEIHDRIKDNSETSRSQLLEKDQLTIVRKDKRAFVEFEETRPQFNPTYKFKANTDDYDMKKRKPAFTDRILYRCSKNDLAINQEHYRSHMQFKQSDHKPVTSVFNLKVRPHVVDKDKVHVQFLAIPTWTVGEDGRARYRFTDSDGNALSARQVSVDRDYDWIGLFREDFTGLDEYFTFVYAVDLYDSLPIAGDNQPGVANSLFTTVFGNVLTPGRFKLVYFNGENSLTVLGVSDAFDIVIA